MKLKGIRVSQIPLISYNLCFSAKTALIKCTLSWPLNFTPPCFHDPLISCNFSTSTGGSTATVRFPSPERGANYVQGHVEIKHEGVWGTICDDKFDANNNGATVLCRMMEFASGEYSTLYRQSSVTKAEKIWLDEVICAGTETDIASCPRAEWGSNNCNHGEDVAIRCTNYIGECSH